MKRELLLPLTLCYCLTAIVAKAQPPANDDATGAVTIAVGAGCSTLYTNVGATQSPNEPLASCSDWSGNYGTGNHQVWFKFTPPPGGAVRISTDNGFGTLDDTQVALFSATDSSDYSTFQVISCDDDNGVKISIKSILYATDLDPNRTYYVLVDGWPYAVGTFCLNIDPLDSTMLSKTNTCGSTYPPVWSGNVNPAYTGWVPLVDNEGKLVCMARYPSGGNASSFSCAQNIHNGTVRQMPNGTYYLDRNYMIRSKELAPNIEIQLFFLNSEFNALNAVAGGNLTLNNLHVVQQDTTCQDDYAVNAKGIDLPQAGCDNQYVGSVNGVSWVTATTPGFPAPGYSDFYLIPGSGIDTITTFSTITGCLKNVWLQPADTTGRDYSWNDGTTGKRLLADSSGLWFVSHVKNCILYLDTFAVHITPLPEIVTDISCKGDQNGKAAVINAPGDSTLFTYTWRNASDSILRGPLQSNHGDTLYHVSAGKYLLKISSPEGCDTLLVVKIPEHDFQAAFDVSDTLICSSDTLNFQNTSNGLDFFQWNFGDGSGTTLGSPQHSFSDPDSYTVQLMGQSADPPCYDTAEKTIIVDPQVPGTFQVMPDSICVGTETVVLISETDSITTTGLHWDFGDGTDRNNDTRERRIQHAYDIAGNLPVTLTTHFRACPDTSFTDTVYVYDFPKVDLGPDSGLCLHGTPIILKNLKDPPAGIYHSLWNTGDTMASLKVVHPGIYSLTVSSEPLNCSTTESIKITKDCYIDIPNAFSPNGDGANDYFFPRQLLSKKITQFKMQIFNRWGELIFETHKINGRGWDGKFNGEPQPEGVYVYVIDASLSNGRKEHYTGNITLLR